MSTRLARLFLSFGVALFASTVYGSSPAKPAGQGTSATAAKSARNSTKKTGAAANRSGDKTQKSEPGTDAKNSGTVAESEPPKRTGVKARLISVELGIVEKTNAERVRNGLAPLAIDDRLMTSARKHATWMTNTRNLQHTSAPVAENIAMGQRTPREAVRSWMNSPGHRANILNRRYRRIGVAAYRTRNGTCYWCQQFLW